jgi:hypothetical protein
MKRKRTISREELEAHSARVQANVKRLRELAERGQAELDRKKRESDAA